MGNSGAGVRITITAGSPVNAPVFDYALSPAGPLAAASHRLFWPRHFGSQKEKRSYQRRAAPIRELKFLPWNSSWKNRRKHLSTKIYISSRYERTVFCVSRKERILPIHATVNGMEYAAAQTSRIIKNPTVASMVGILLCCEVTRIYFFRSCLPCLIAFTEVRSLWSFPCPIASTEVSSLCFRCGFVN
jgi:hypothetical protein